MLRGAAARAALLLQLQQHQQQQFHHARAAQEHLPAVGAWLQHMLSRSTAALVSGEGGGGGGQRSLHTSAPPSSAAAPGHNKQQQKKQQTQQQQQQQQQQAPAWKLASRSAFSVRPSALSPLHALHRELEDIEQRLGMLDLAMTAHLRLSQELGPDELRAHAHAPDPAAAALAARRQALAETKAAYDRLRREQVPPARAPEHAAGYFGVLEGLQAEKDADAAEFARVLEGDRDVWDYWFTHFAPQYEGLPGLGRVERLFSQPDEEVTLRRMAQLRAAAPKPPPQPQVDPLGRARAKGGRKTSVARVILWRGGGRVLVNRTPLDTHFGDVLHRSALLRPLQVAGLAGKVDVLVQVAGGGLSGQAQAAAHGIARALRRLDPGLKPRLKAAGLLKRDPRMVERKKPGRAKARKGFAWVKR